MSYIKRFETLTSKNTGLTFYQMRNDSYDCWRTVSYKLVNGKIVKLQCKKQQRTNYKDSACYINYDIGVYKMGTDPIIDILYLVDAISYTGAAIKSRKLFIKGVPYKYNRHDMRTGRIIFRSVENKEKTFTVNQLITGIYNNIIQLEDYNTNQVIGIW